jgi:3-oxoacyl-[acyl-carrier-protein] synthase II
VSEVVVTGVGAVTPLGVGAAKLHERWAAGVCGIENGEGRCDELVVSDHFSVKEARRADRFAQLVLVAAGEALAAAGWDSELPYDATRIGAIIGTGIGGIGTIEANDRTLLEQGPKLVSPLAVPLMMGNAGAAAVSMRHGLKGPSYGVVSACAAGTHAIGSAMRAIQYGDATAVVAGGTEAALTPLSRAAFAAVDALSPSGISRPFDARRDGFVMGEGAGGAVM